MIMRRATFAIVASLALTMSVTGRARSTAAAVVPYRAVPNWAQLPAGTAWGVMSWVSTDQAGNVYTLQRDEPTSKVFVFASDGRFLREFADGAFPYAHSLRVLRDGAVWVTDRKMQQVLKFDVKGALLTAIGQKNVAGDNGSRSAFNGVSDIVMTGDGNLFASDGEGGNTRVVKLSPQGTFLDVWGTKGAGPGQLNGPHCITTDSRGRLYVCDRSNKRVEMFDQAGTYLGQMTQFGTPVSIAITPDDQMFVASPAPENRVTIGTTSGSVLGTIDGLDSPHGIAVDPEGSVYVAESSGHAVLKFVRQ